MEKVLSVKNLSINFRTVNGQVQAVRGVSFDLHKGETMAIVGESGSGKSVTSRAILGILANNAIVKGGKIFYDGKDLLKIDEEQFHEIRGDKIAMIFQDPLSSLNPIMRIGNQLTEAMLLKNKANRKESRKKFNKIMEKLVQYMNYTGTNYEISNEQKAKDFNQFEYKHLELENAYNSAVSFADDVYSDIENLTYEISRNSFLNVKKYITNICKYAMLIQDRFFIRDLSRVTTAVQAIQNVINVSIKEKSFNDIIVNCNIIKGEIEEARKYEKPNFFSLAYYLTFVDSNIPEYPIAELNAMTRKFLDDKFMLEFISRVEKALAYSHNESIDNTKKSIDSLNQLLQAFKQNSLDKKQIMSLSYKAVEDVENSIDKLDIYRKSKGYVFRSSLIDSMKMYYSVDDTNAALQKKYDKDKVAYDKVIAKGKVPNWNLVPVTLWDKEQVKNEIIETIEDMIQSCNDYLSVVQNYNQKAIDMIDYLKQNASNVVNKLTKSAAKLRAIKLMEEVGIPEPNKRYRQYPFEFSGGMRQRIVIAIALAANPEILICDEPTTALDVTIQSQILELINKLKAERNLSIIFITHDMGVVANMADRISVMYAGKIVETGTADEVFYDPKHPYTWALLSSMPDLDTKDKLDSIPGTPPNMINPPIGDAFAARNKYAMKIDFEQQPPFFKISDTHYAATWLLHPNAPKVEMPKSLVERIERMKKGMEGEKNE